MDRTKILFGDLNFQKFSPIKNSQSGEKILYNFENGNVIDDLLYHKMVGYVRKMHGIKVKPMKVKGTQAVKAVLENERLKMLENKNSEYVSVFKNLISAMLVYPGFKYKSSELKQCGIYEFIDSVQRSQIFMSSSALMSGIYSGMIDISKVDKNRLNWLRDFNEK